MQCKLNTMKMSYLHSARERVIKVLRFCARDRQMDRQRERGEKPFGCAWILLSLSGDLLCCPDSHINEMGKAWLSWSHWRLETVLQVRRTVQNSCLSSHLGSVVNRQVREKKKHTEAKGEEAETKRLWEDNRGHARSQSDTARETPETEKRAGWQITRDWQCGPDSGQAEGVSVYSWTHCWLLAKSPAAIKVWGWSWS